MEHAKYTEYIEKIEKKLSRYFDIEKYFLYKDIKIDLFAKYCLRNEKYVGSKKLSIYGFENHEYCMIKYFNEIDHQDFQKFIDILKVAVDDFVTPHSEHMSSIVTGVVVVDHCAQEIIDRVKKFKFHKSFSFGFKGWVDIRLILVCLDKGEVITNKKGKEVQEVYQI